jgi:hypothetical protein
MCGRSLIDPQGALVFPETVGLCLESIQEAAIKDPQNALSYQSLCLAYQYAVEICRRGARANEVCIPASNLTESTIESMSTDRILTSLKTILCNLPSGIVDHWLVWVLFIAAAQSSNAENRMFFCAKLEGIHRTTGFFNIPRMVDLLRQKIWPAVDRLCIGSILASRPLLPLSAASADVRRRGVQNTRLKHNWISIVYQENNIFII